MLISILLVGGSKYVDFSILGWWSQLTIFSGRRFDHARSSETVTIFSGSETTNLFTQSISILRYFFWDPDVQPKDFHLFPHLVHLLQGVSNFSPKFFATSHGIFRDPRVAGEASEPGGRPTASGQGLLQLPGLGKLDFFHGPILELWRHMGLSENRVYSQWNSHLIGIMIINHWV